MSLLTPRVCDNSVARVKEHVPPYVVTAHDLGRSLFKQGKKWRESTLNEI